MILPCFLSLLGRCQVLGRLTTVAAERVLHASIDDFDKLHFRSFVRFVKHCFQCLTLFRDRLLLVIVKL